MERSERSEAENLSHARSPLARNVPPGIRCHHHQGEDAGYGNWAPMSPNYRSFYDDEDSPDHHHQGKRSIMMKVKEKAKKWRQMLVKKKHGHDGDNSTPPWGVSLDEGEEEDPEYHGAPMYESELAPEIYKHASPYQIPACQFMSRTVPAGKPSICQVRIAGEESEMKQANDMYIKQQETKVMPPINTCDNEIKNKAMHQDQLVSNNASNKKLTEKVAEVIAPAYIMVSEATNIIALKMQESRPEYESAAKQVWDKGVSMKEYLMQKLEPGEEDRALCQVITEAVSPRNAGHSHAEPGVLEKCKEAVSSLLGREEPLGSPIPLSTNPHPEVIEASGRTKQAYTN